MRQPGKSLVFPFYNPAAWRSLPIPDLSDPRICGILAACWTATRNEVVPQFRDGYTDVRRRWDATVCAALGWDIDEITELGGCSHASRALGESRTDSGRHNLNRLTSLT